MHSSFADTILTAYYGLATAMICAQLLVLYALSTTPRAPAGLGFYSVYFMTALFWGILAAISGILGWRSRNTGDVIIALGGVAMCAAMLALVMPLLSTAVAPATAAGLAYALQGGAHVFAGVGFLASILVDQRQQLAHLTTLDPLTRLLNRRGLEKALHVTFATADRHDQSTAAMMLNIDHLQQLNDHFGADTGDKVLQQVSRALEAECRASDVLARYDGNSFLIILSNSDLAAARKLADRIRERVADASLRAGDQPVTAAVSLGIAEALGAVNLDQLCKAAGLALQLAKRGGGNRVAAVERRPIQLSNSTAGH